MRGRDAKAGACPYHSRGTARRAPYALLLFALGAAGLIAAAACTSSSAAPIEADAGVDANVEEEEDDDASEDAGPQLPPKNPVRLRHSSRPPRPTRHGDSPGASGRLRARATPHLERWAGSTRPEGGGSTQPRGNLGVLVQKGTAMKKPAKEQSPSSSALSESTRQARSTFSAFGRARQRTRSPARPCSRTCRRAG